MRLSHRSKLALAVLAALVLPSALAWGFQAVTPDSHRTSVADRAPRTPTPSPTPGSPSATPSPTAQVDAPASPAQQGQRLPSSVAPEPPTHVRLPGGRMVRVRPSNSLPDGSLGIPDDLRTAAWWRGGARLGDLYGSMLVAAHVDSRTRGLGPFVTLLTVRRGARVTVFSPHLRRVYRVEARRVLPRARLAHAHWVSSFRGPHRLTLVTCAPPYVKARGGYQNLAVVVAVPVGPPRRR